MYIQRGVVVANNFQIMLRSARRTPKAEGKSMPTTTVAITLMRLKY